MLPWNSQGISVYVVSWASLFAFVTIYLHQSAAIVPF